MVRDITNSTTCHKNIKCIEDRNSGGSDNTVSEQSSRIGTCGSVIALPPASTDISRNAAHDSSSLNGTYDIPPMSLFRELLVSGVFAFVDVVNKKVLVVHSLHMMRTFSEHMAKLVNHTHPILDLQRFYNNLALTTENTQFRLRILTSLPMTAGEQEHAHLQKLLMCKSYWMRVFVNNGYTLWNRKEGLKYQIKYYQHQGKVFVSLCDSRKEKEVVGVFNKIEEAKEWVNDTYTLGPDREVLISKIFYATNPLTIQFLDAIRNTKT